MTLLFGRYPRIVRLLEMMSTIYQKFYDRSMEFLLSIPGIKNLVLHYFWLLMRFRLACITIGDRYTQTELGIIGIFLATVASRLKFSGVFVTISLIFCHLELQFQNMAKFYRKQPTLLAQHFPEGQDPKRNMHRVTQAIVDSLSNPTVVAVGAGVAGALGWKALDVWDTTKQERMAEKDREATSLNAQKDRDEEYRRHRENIEAEDRRFDKQVQAEAIERQKDRDYALQGVREQIIAEDRRHKDSLEIENQKNRETRLSDNDYSKDTASFTDSTQIVD